MAGVLAMKGRCLRADNNSSLPQLRSQLKHNQSPTFPNASEPGYNRETISKRRGNNTKCNSVAVSRTENKSTSYHLLCPRTSQKSRTKVAKLQRNLSRVIRW